MQITLRNIQYHPDAAGSVALYCEHDLGAFHLNTTQAALAARTNAGLGGGVWSDTEVLAEAQAILDGTAGAEIMARQGADLVARAVGKGHTAVLP